MQKIKNSMKLNKVTIIFIVLIAWAVFSMVFIARNYWRSFKNVQIKEAVSQGYTQGYGQAIYEVATVAEQCQAGTVPLNLGNDKDGNPMSLDIVVYAAKCLEQNTGQPGDSAEEAEEAK